MATQPSNALDVLLQALSGSQSSSATVLSSSETQGQTLPTTITSISISSTISRAIFTTLTTTTTTTIPSIASSTLVTAQAINTTVSAAPTASQSHTAGAVAGITTGSVAAVVLILLALLYFFRLRRRDEKDRDGSTSSLLSKIGSINESKNKKNVFPEVAWLYDPLRSSDRPAQPSNDSAPKLGANLPWTSRPSTGRDDDGPPRIGALPHEAAELPAVSVARNIDPTLLQPVKEGSSAPRRFSYPVRQTPPAPEAEDGNEVISPLLPQPSVSFARAGREQYGHSPTSSYGSEADFSAVHRDSSLGRGGQSPDLRTPLRPESYGRPRAF